MPHISRYRTQPDGTLVCENPISKEVEAAIAIADEARRTVERNYRELISLIAQGQQPDAVELIRLATALGKTENQIAEDAELRVAEIEDERAIAQCEDEKAALQKRIVKAQATIKEAQADQAKNEKVCHTLRVEIEKRHRRVAVKEKATLAKVLDKNWATAAVVQETKKTIEQLQAEIENMRPKIGAVGRLRTRQYTLKQQARERQDLAEARPYLEPDLPHGELRAIISPKSRDDDSDVRPNERKISIGKVNGEPTFATVKLG